MSRPFEMMLGGVSVKELFTMTYEIYIVVLSSSHIFAFSLDSRSF